MTKDSFLLNFFIRQGIAKKLLLWIVFFSSIITLVLSGIQLFIDYRLELNTINSRFGEIEQSYKGSIEASLWNVDLEQLTIQMEGIKQLPDIQAVIVTETDDVSSPVVLEKGDQKDGQVSREYILERIDNNQVIVIGTLYVEATLSEVYQRLLNKALTIMVVQAIKTFLVSFFILYVFYRLVTRHIISIEHFLTDINLREPKQLSLDRPSNDTPDELDHLVVAYNSMIADLRQAYTDMQTVNTRLKEDIAARKRAESEVGRLNEELELRVQLRTAELEAANKELNAFCYSVSHDLRAPLRRVEGFRRTIDTEYTEKLDQRAIHYLSRMGSCTQEMNAMIDSFLILAKSTSTELRLEEVNLSDVVQRILNKLQERDSHREVEVQIQKNITAVCDPRLVELLLTNLLDNSWKYTSKVDKAEISFRRKKQKGTYIFIVKDNGAGFNMDFAANLFSPFTRLHKLSDFQGMGIGLATVKRVVSRHAGTVWAESAVGEGATFFFTLKSSSLRPDQLNS